MIFPVNEMLLIRHGELYIFYLLSKTVFGTGTMQFTQFNTNVLQSILRNQVNRDK